MPQLNQSGLSPMESGSSRLLHRGKYSWFSIVWPSIYGFWLPLWYLRSFFNYLVFQSFDFGCTWWRWFQKRFEHIKADIDLRFYLLRLYMEEWASGWCLTPTQQFFSCIMTRTSWFSMRLWQGPLYTRSTRLVGFL